jgi:hypothetical protein
MNNFISGELMQEIALKVEGSRHADSWGISAPIKF